MPTRQVKKIRLVSFTIYPTSVNLKIIIDSALYEYSSNSDFVKHLLLDIQETGRPLTFKDLNKIKRHAETKKTVLTGEDQ